MIPFLGLLCCGPVRSAPLSWLPHYQCWAFGVWYTTVRETSAGKEVRGIRAKIMETGHA